MPSSNAAAYRDVLRVLFRLAQPYKTRFAVIVALAVLGAGADLLQPLIYRVAINDVAGLFVGRPISRVPTHQPGGGGSFAYEHAEKELQHSGKTLERHRPGFVAPRTGRQALTTLLESVAWLFVIGVTGYFLSLAADYQSVVAGSRIEAQLIQSTFGHVLRFPLGFFSRRASGGLAKRIDQCDQVAPVVAAFTQQIVPECLRVAGICVIMLTQSWKLALVALGVLPLYLLITRRAALRLESGMSEYYTMWENVSARIQDALAAIKTVKLSGAEQRETERLQKATQAAYDDYVGRSRTGNRYFLAQNVLSQLSKALVLGYGGWMVLERRLTPGDVVMFVAYLDRLFEPIESLSSMAVSLQQNLASLRRAVQLLQTGPEEPRGAALADGPGKVEFRDVRFGYTPRREVLHGLNFTIEPAKTTALTGPSGAGKTTAADLLLKLWEPDSGEILVDGQPLSQADPAAVRRAIGLVATDGAVFRGTLADNIRYKRPDATDAEVREAALSAGLGGALDRLPDGLDTEVGERGMGLSAGERQRLQIARILVDQPRILVLDEATANLDYATEAEVKSALDRLRCQGHRLTTLVIAHRYSMIKDADHVIVLEQGRILAQGSPAELAVAGGWFAQLAAQATEKRAEDIP
jgi:ABC-type multidrug transport system fused ATPase/permease subunit